MRGHLKKKKKKKKKEREKRGEEKKTVCFVSPWHFGEKKTVTRKTDKTKDERIRINITVKRIVERLEEKREGRNNNSRPQTTSHHNNK